jgi:hypothetical protein
MQLPRQGLPLGLPEPTIFGRPSLKCRKNMGHVEAMNRGDLEWLITIPSNGSLLLEVVSRALALVNLLRPMIKYA